VDEWDSLTYDAVALRQYKYTEVIWQDYALVSGGKKKGDCELGKVDGKRGLISLQMQKR
jgi:hypothetical protein